MAHDSSNADRGLNPGAGDNTVRVFGMIEAVFDICYLVSGIVTGLVLLLSPSVGAGILTGVMALVLIAGDAFHLVPRMILIFTGKEEKLRPALGRGKQITSITMTFFYILLWQLGVVIFAPSDILVWSCIVYALALIRVILCLHPGNRWTERYPPVGWGIARNIPLLFQGACAAALYFVWRYKVHSLRFVWLAVILSFVFYLPVVLRSHKNRKVGMLMLPKSAAYIWLLTMFLSA